VLTGGEGGNSSKNRNMEELRQELDQIKAYSLLAAKNVLNLEDVALLTGYSRSHLYKLTCTHQIPYYKPQGKVIYFDRKEVEDWMRQNRVSTTQEAEQQAAAYLVANPTPTTKRKGGRK